MQKHIDQAIHNQELYDLISHHFKGRFLDWKITILFYIAIHYLKALAKLKGIQHLGSNHTEIGDNINPKSHNPRMPLTKDAYDNYKLLYKTSRSVRYDGIKSMPFFEASIQADHKYCIDALTKFKTFIKAQGVRVQ